MNARVPSAHRLIRQIGTGLYLSPRGEWVESEEDAFDFPDLRSAIATYESIDHRGVELVLVFERENPPPRHSI
jgi:hypothetical protein